MIEIAIALGVIGFALVAIVGLLPYGLTTQKDNREDTIINQDSSYFLEAIRSGAKGIDDLTNFVEFITISNFPSRSVTNYSYGTKSTNFLLGWEIVGLLSQPKFILDTNGWPVETNYVTAQIRAMSGSALDLEDSQGVVGLRYQLTSEVVSFATDESRKLTKALHELRLRFEWPLVGADKERLGRLAKHHRSMVLSTLVSGSLTNESGYYFFDKQQF